MHQGEDMTAVTWGDERYVVWGLSLDWLEGGDTMGVTVYAEEATDRIMILSKEAEGATLTGYNCISRVNSQNMGKTSIRVPLHSGKPVTCDRYFADS